MSAMDVYVPAMSSIALQDGPRSPKSAPGATFDPCSCISYLKSRRPDLQEAWGTPQKYAETHSLGYSPWVGAAVILKEGPVWHVAYIESIAGETMTVSESNYVPCQAGTRTLPLDYEAIAGFL